MQAMTSFISWLCSNVPSFFMSEPIIYFISIWLLAIALKAISTLFISRRY